MAITWDLPEAIVLDPADEAERLEALQSLNLLGTEAEDRFDRITQLAAEFFQVPMAYVAFFDAERQYYKSSVGFCPAVTERNLSLCQYTLRGSDPLIINDAQDHSLTRNHPMVTGDPGLRFYAGVPLAGPRGKKIGTFCLLDLKPREFTPDQLARLKAFATIVEREISLTDIIQTQNDLLRTREQLVEAQDKLKHEFDDAIKYVRLMLPPPLSGREIIDWQFHPSTHLGGDGLGYRRINADQIAFYILDVTGHGLGSALLAVTALELLRSRAVRQLDFSQPSQVIDRLNHTFQMKDHAGKFFPPGMASIPIRKRSSSTPLAAIPPLFFYAKAIWRKRNRADRLLASCPSSMQPRRRSISRVAPKSASSPTGSTRSWMTSAITDPTTSFSPGCKSGSAAAHRSTIRCWNG